MRPQSGPTRRGAPNWSSCGKQSKRASISPARATWENLKLPSLTPASRSTKGTLILSTASFESSWKEVTLKQTVPLLWPLLGLLLATTESPAISSRKLWTPAWKIAHAQGMRNTPLPKSSKSYKVSSKFKLKNISKFFETDEIFPIFWY